MGNVVCSGEATDAKESGIRRDEGIGQTSEACNSCLPASCNKVQAAANTEKASLWDSCSGRRRKSVPHSQPEREGARNAVPEKRRDRIRIREDGSVRRKRSQCMERGHATQTKRQGVQFNVNVFSSVSLLDNDRLAASQ